MHPFEEAAGKAVLARPATPDDPTSEVMVLGEDFDYLVVGPGNELMTVDRDESPSAPARIVVDADSFLSGLTKEHNGFEFEFIAIRRSDKLAIRVQAVGPAPKGTRVFPEQ